MFFSEFLNEDKEGFLRCSETRNARGYAQFHGQRISQHQKKQWLLNNAWCFLYFDFLNKHNKLETTLKQSLALKKYFNLALAASPHSLWLKVNIFHCSFILFHFFFNLFNQYANLCDFLMSRCLITES